MVNLMNFQVLNGLKESIVLDECVYS